MLRQVRQKRGFTIEEASRCLPAVSAKLYEEWENGFGIGAWHLHSNACGATEAWGVDFDLLVPIPDGVDIYDFHLIMFNRWGVIVWESYNTVGRWDGTYGGDSVQDGVYVWVIHAKDRENDKVYEFKEL